MLKKKKLIPDHLWSYSHMFDKTFDTWLAQFQILRQFFKRNPRCEQSLMDTSVRC